MNIDLSSLLRRTAFVVATLVLVPSPAVAQDAAAGKAVFAKECAACHTVADSNGIGPGLKGIDGRKVGSAAGFRYSSAMAAVKDSWDAKSLDGFIAAPTKAIPGSAMPYAGLGDAKSRADVVAYLQTLK